MQITLYSTNCPKCMVLKKKLMSKDISFSENNNVEDMIKLGFTMSPMLVVDSDIMDFNQANTWINNKYEVEEC